MAKHRTIPEFRMRLKKYNKGIGKVVLPVMRKGQREIKKEMRREYATSSDLARIIYSWASNKKSWQGAGRSGGSIFLGSKKVKPSINPRKKAREWRAKWDGGRRAWTAGVLIVGMAAGIEEGGRLRVHKIFGGAKKGMPERRPGIRVPERAIRERIEDREWNIVVRDAGRAHWDYLNKTL